MIKIFRHSSRPFFWRANLTLVIAATIVIALSLFSTRSIRAAGPTCTVPGDYSTIKAAVADAGCLTINVGAGTYNEYDIIISRNVKIVGNSGSPSSVIIDAGNTTHRGFYLNAGYVITISGVTIQHGNAGGSGGAIENHGTLWLDHSFVISNTITGGSGGGGIHNIGTATLNNVVLKANIAPTSPLLAGGAIYNDTGGSLTVTLGSIDSNTAGFSGGAIENHGRLMLTNLSIRGNRVNGDIGGGEPGGGGILNQGYAVLQSVDLSSNDTEPFGTQGGAIYNGGTGVMRISTSHITTNTATSYGSGGGISNSGLLTLTNSTLRANNAFVEGGGLYNPGTVIIDSSLFLTNVVSDQGGGLTNGGAATISNSTFSGNYAASEGGGIINFNILTVVNSTLIGNSASNDGGGLKNDVSATLSNTTLLTNTASTGGGIFNGSAGALTITRSSLIGNVATTNNGGGIHNVGSLRVMTDTFANNTALNGSGGGLDNSGNGTANIDSSTFSANTANSDGGAIYSASNNPLNLTNDTFSGNSASTGGGLAHNTGTLTILNSTFKSNSASTGGNFSRSSGTLSIKNTIIASGSPANCSGSITNGGHNLQYGDLSCGGAIANSNPLLGPLQINAPGKTATQALLIGSPAIDTGTNTGCPATDQRGVVRPINSTCDIGAYEYGLTLKVFLPLTLKNH